MTSGPEHYRLAGQALAHSHSRDITAAESKLWVAAASVHASLARTAALIQAEMGDYDTWREIFSAAADQARAEPLVTCGYPHPTYSDWPCTAEPRHLEGWPAIDIPHNRFVAEIGETITWRDHDHPDPAKLCMVPGETTCGALVSGKPCMLLPAHEGVCAPYGVVPAVTT